MNLIETVEDLLALGGSNANAGVDDLDGEVVVLDLRSDIDLAALGRELDGVGEQVEDNLGKRFLVDPQLGGRGYQTEVGKGDVASLGEVEHRIAEVLQEGYGRLEMALELHLRLVDLAQVHEFVDEGEHTVGIAVDEFEGLLVLGAVVALHEFLERADDEGHRGTELMGDVHEELQLGIVDGILTFLFGLEATFGTLATDELVDEPDDSCEDGIPQQDGPP